jgi:hypothetical protein
MKKMKYFGTTMQTQRIKAKRSPKIEVVGANKRPTEDTIKGDQFIEFKVVSEAGRRKDRARGKVSNAKTWIKSGKQKKISKSPNLNGTY